MTKAMSPSTSEEMVSLALAEVIDPELGINIVDLGLIYSTAITEDGRLSIVMTLTTPGCPMHASFAQEIERVLWRSLPVITGVSIELVWHPPWNPMMISPKGRALLGLA
jgi:metal-sulfur cluster biosynthetic enzyme